MQRQFGSFISRLFGPNAALSASFLPLQQSGQSPSREIYGLLDVYYGQNAIYDQLRQAAYASALGQEDLVALRNPVHRVVESYATHLMPGTLPDALPIIVENERIIDPIHQTWQWSNWNARKQVFARWLALYGDGFIKVVTTEDKRRVFFQLIRPHYVTDMQADERGVLEYIRLDVPQAIRQGDRIVSLTHTEVWTGESYRLWQHDKHSERDHVELEDLGTPDVEMPLTAFGIDFIPIVYVPFIDIGNVRAAGAVTHALDKIDEVNRQATRLHAMLFRHNDSTWAVESDVTDKNNRPLAPPRIGTPDTNNPADASKDTVTFGATNLVRLPSGWHLQSLVPDIHYGEALAILNAMMDELETDLPEMAFYKIRNMNQRALSGVALRLLLSDAVARIEEARGNAEAGLARADMMALTIGKGANLWSGDIGDYAAGDYHHTFATRPVIELGADEEAASVMLTLPLIGPTEALTQLGYEPDKIKEILAEKKAMAPPPPPPAIIASGDAAQADNARANGNNAGMQPAGMKE